MVKLTEEPKYIIKIDQLVLIKKMLKYWVGRILFGTISICRQPLEQNLSMSLISRRLLVLIAFLYDGLLLQSY